jgi:hypothetical protein
LKVLSVNFVVFFGAGLLFVSFVAGIVAIIVATVVALSVEALARLLLPDWAVGKLERLVLYNFVRIISASFEGSLDI